MASPITPPPLPRRPSTGAQPARATVYHGTTHAIDRFDPAFLGSGAGHDQEGPGFYFTSDPRDAATYALSAPHGEILTCDVVIADLVPTQRRALPRSTEWLLASSPDLAERLQDWGEDPRDAFRQALAICQDQGSAHESFQSVWFDFYRGYEAAYLERLCALGYSGVVSEKTAAPHLIVFDPAAISVVSRSPVAVALESPTLEADAAASKATLHTLAAGANGSMASALRKLREAAREDGPAPLDVPAAIGRRRLRESRAVSGQFVVPSRRGIGTVNL
jgi:hypothetical protein